MLTVGETLSHHKIISAIGEGGKGEVYLAQDTKLGRQVALKVLLDEVAGDEERVKRFVHEAKAASALNHPNILTVYESVGIEIDETMPPIQYQRSSLLCGGWASGRRVRVDDVGMYLPVVDSMESNLARLIQLIRRHSRFSRRTGTLSMRTIREGLG